MSHGSATYPSAGAVQNDASLQQAAAALRAGQRGSGEPLQGRRRRHRGRGPEAVRDEIADALQSLAAELAAARHEAERLRERLARTEALRLEEARELGELRRQRDGLQFRTDYLEEKLDQIRRRPAASRRSWWRRW